MRNQRGRQFNNARTFNKYPSAPDGRGATSIPPRTAPVGKDPYAVETANDVIEENATDRFYVLRGHAGTTAVQVIYLDNNWIFDEPTKEQSLAKAKLAVRMYRAAHGLDNPFAPDHRWATIAPVVL